MATHEMHVWDLWIADVGATGISFARGRLDPTETMIVHAAPETLNVEVRNAVGTVLARGQDLARTIDSPMAKLRVQGNTITREDFWPTTEHLFSLLEVKLVSCSAGGMILNNKSGDGVSSFTTTDESPSPTKECDNSAGECQRLARNLGRHC